MNTELFHYKENLPDDLNIQHKIAYSTEKKTFHLHTHDEIIYALSDNLIYRTDTGDYPIPPQSFLLIPSMMLHKIDYLPESGLCDRHVLYFSPELVLSLCTPEVNLLDCFVRKQAEPAILLLPDAQSGIIRTSMEQMEAVQKENQVLCKEDNPARYHRNQMYLKLELGKILLLLNHFYQEKFGLPASISYQSHSQTVSEVCQYIDEHFSEQLAIEQLSKEFLLSKTQLYNIFREVLGMSVSDYISHVRITQAKALLINTGYSVEIISQKAGYTNISSFSRVFKDKAGASPLQYRKSRRG